MPTSIFELTFRSYFSYLPTALAAILGGFLWQIMVLTTGANQSARWVVAFVLVFGGIAAGVSVLLVRPRTLPAAAVPAVARVIPLSGRPAGWRFDEASSFIADSADDYLLLDARPTLERALITIFENPLASPRQVAKGEVVYIQRIDAGNTQPEDGRPAALLLGYIASPRDRMIRIIGVKPAADVTAVDLAEDTEALSALQRVTETAMARARGLHHTPVTEG